MNSSSVKMKESNDFMLNIFGWFLQQKLKQSFDDKNRSRRHHFFSHFSFNSRTFFHRYLVKLSQTFNL